MIQQIDWNFNAHACRIPKEVKGMLVHHSPNLSYVDSGLPCDTFNIIHIINGKDLEEQELVAAITHYKKQSSPYCIWINAENFTPKVKEFLTNVRQTEQGEEVAMALELVNYEPASFRNSNNILLK